MRTQVIFTFNQSPQWSDHFWRRARPPQRFQNSPLQPQFLGPRPNPHTKSLEGESVRQRHQGVILVLTVRNISPFRRKIRLHTMTSHSFMARSLAWVMPIKQMIFFIRMRVQPKFQLNGRRLNHFIFRDSFNKIKWFSPSVSSSSSSLLFFSISFLLSS